MEDKRWNHYLKELRFRDRSVQSASDGRDPFENDYSRLISSAPIRRLQDKTQVFPLEKSDFVRTRLTHSLEVSSIARSLGKSVEARLKVKFPAKLKGQLASLLSTAGLVHDLGNPPFGHFGEKAIQSYFNKYFSSHEINLSEQEKADFTKFDGNVQTFRILRSLYFLFDENGYNLTYPTLHTIVKYPCSSTDGYSEKHSKDIRHKKYGFFSSEQADFNTITKALKLNSIRHPATFLLEAADDIAYSSADIEDAVKLGILDYERVREIFGPYAEKSKVGKQLMQSFQQSYEELSEFNLDVNDIVIQRFRIKLQTILIESVIDEFINSYEKIMTGEYKTDLLKKCKAVNLKEGLDSLLSIVLKNKKIINIELAGWNVIEGLLQEYIPACLDEKFKANSKTKEGRLYLTISSSYRYLYENYNMYPHDSYRRIQLITDFISGMTDNYALELYQKLKGIRTV